MNAIRKIRIVLVSVRADYGGGPEHLFQLLRYGCNKVAFYVACPREEPYYRRYTSVIGGRICELPHRKFTFRALIRLVRFINKHRIQLIHTHGKGAGVYGRLAGFITGIPNIHTPHGIHTGEYGKIKKRLYIMYENLTACRVNHVCFVSPSERTEAQRLGLWLRTRSSVVPNGVAEVPMRVRRAWAAKIRNKLEIKGQNPAIAMLSRFDYPKNMYEAYEIAKRCGNMTFLWIGDGPDKSALENKARTEGVRNIIFTGYVRRPKLYLAASDIYLSTSRWEGMPLGVLEAMSIGLPVVAADVPGNRDAVLDGRTGYLYPLGQPLRAAEYLRSIARNKNLYTQLSTQALTRQRNKYSINEMVNTIIRIYGQNIQND